MARIALTTKMLEKLKAGDKPVELRDAVCPNLCAIIHPTGRIVFAFRGKFDGKPGKKTLGTYPLHSLETARTWGFNIQRNLDHGIDVIQADKDRQKADHELSIRTCDWLFDKYMAHEGDRRRSAKEKRRLYEREIKPYIGSKSYASISHNDLARILQAKAAVSSSVSNALQALIRRWFRWSVTTGRHITDLTINPAADLTKLAETSSRDRVLSDEEISLFLTALASRKTPFGNPLRLVLHTGARRAEVFGMNWSEVNFARGEWLIPRERSKNGVELLLPLPQIMIDMLAAQYALRTTTASLVWPSRNDPHREMSGFSKVVSTLNLDMSIAAGYQLRSWTIHDLRRTMVSGMNGLLDNDDRSIIQPHIVERLVNHKIGGVQGIYNRHNYYAEKKAALRAWADHLRTLIPTGPWA